MRHGDYALLTLKLRAVEAVEAATRSPHRYRDAAWFVEGTRRVLDKMTYAQFRAVRPAITAFCRGDTSLPRLADYLNFRRDPAELLDRE